MHLVLRLIALIFVMVGTEVYAYPRVGDFVRYQGCAVKESKCVSFTREQEILAVASPTHLVTLIQRYYVEDEDPQLKVRTLKKSAFRTPALFLELLSKCQGGDEHSKFAVVQVSVPAGSFRACKQTNLIDGAETYIADVPFGFVKVVSKGLQYELVSFRDGFGSP